MEKGATKRKKAPRNGKWHTIAENGDTIAGKWRHQTEPGQKKTHQKKMGKRGHGKRHHETENGA